MNIRNIKQSCIFAFVVIALIVGIVLNSIFLFNPLTFRKDDITPYDWQDYRKPIEVVYYYWDTIVGWKEVSIVQGGKEAKFIVSELKKTNEIVHYLKDYLLPLEKRGKECKVVIRRVLGQSKYQNMLDFNYFENGDISDFSNSNYIELTKELKTLLLSKL
jgi:hypothetical protein